MSNKLAIGLGKMKNSIRKNYLYNLSYQLLIIITPLLTTPYLSRVLGADRIGNISYADSIVSYFILFATLGINIYGQREFSYVQDSKSKRTEIFWNTKCLELITVILALIIYTAYALRQENRGLYLVLSLNIIVVFADITWFFQGVEEFGKIIVRNTIFKIVNITYIFLFIKGPDDFIKHAFGLAVFSLLSNISLWFYIPHYIASPKTVKISPFRDINVILSLFFPTIAIQIYTVLDKTMIGLITKNAFENGYYEQAIKISKMMLTIVTALGTVMIPRIGYFFGNKDVKEIQRLMYRGYRFVWFIGVPLCFGLISVSDNMVPWFFGDGYEKVAVLLKILAYLILAIGISNVTGLQYLIPTKRQNIFTLTVVIGAVVNLFMNVLLIPRLQSIGAAIASVIAETVIAVVQLIFLRNELSPRRVVLEGIPYFGAGSFMTLIVILIGSHLNPSLVNTALLVLSGIVVYFAVLFVIKDDFFMSNVNSLLGKFKRRG